MGEAEPSCWCKERPATSNSSPSNGLLDGEADSLLALLWSGRSRSALRTAERCAEPRERKARVGSPAPKAGRAAGASRASGVPSTLLRVSAEPAPFSADARPDAKPDASTPAGHAGMRALVFRSGDCLRKERSRLPSSHGERLTVNESATPSNASTSSGSGGSGVPSELHPSLSISMSLADICTARSVSLIGPVARGGAGIGDASGIGARTGRAHLLRLPIVLTSVVIFSLWIGPAVASTHWTFAQTSRTQTRARLPAQTRAASR